MLGKDGHPGKIHGILILKWLALCCKRETQLLL